MRRSSVSSYVLDSRRAAAYVGAVTSSLLLLLAVGVRLPEVERLPPAPPNNDGWASMTKV
jgi:hypothetical protein